MAFTPTLLTGAVGDSLAGKPALNTPDDVRKVQALLTTALGCEAPRFNPGVCDGATLGAIADFQGLWGGRPDRRVDPGGQTLKRLDRLANPVELKPVSLKNARRGGYLIKAETCDGGPLPPDASGYERHLVVMHMACKVDVSRQPLTDLLDSKGLAALLAQLDKLGMWGVPVLLWLQVSYRGQQISLSQCSAVLDAPVRPVNDRLLPLDVEGNQGPLPYQQDPVTSAFCGRLLLRVAGFDKNVLIYAGKLETDKTKRGFDCVTYAAAVCDAEHGHSAEGSDLATSLGTLPVSISITSQDAKTNATVTTSVTLESASPDHVKQFFNGPAPGYYIMYSSSHVVMVAGGEVHEFKASDPSGYARTPVATWLEPYKKKTLTVRKVPVKPARAV